MIAMISTTVATTPYGPMRTVSPETLLQHMRSDVPLTVVDVRDRSQVHATGVISGARLFPLAQLGARVDELAHCRAIPLIVVSQRAHRAQEAVLELQGAGFAEVMTLEGGMQRWLELGYPIEERCVPSVRP